MVKTVESELLHSQRFTAKLGGTVTVPRMRSESPTLTVVSSGEIVTTASGGDGGGSSFPSSSAAGPAHATRTNSASGYRTIQSPVSEAFTAKTEGREGPPS